MKTVTWRVLSLSFVIALLILLCVGCTSKSVAETTPPHSPSSSFSTPSPSSSPTSVPPPSSTPEVESPSPEPLPLDAVDMEELWYWYSQLEGVQREGYIELFDAVMAWIAADDTSVEPYEFRYEMSTPGFTMDDYEILRYVSEDNPLIMSFFTLGADEINGKVTYVEALMFSHEAINQMAQEMESEANRLLSGLITEMSDYEKYHYIANELCMAVSYDYEAFGFMNTQELLEHEDYIKKILASTAYGGIVRKLAVCEGYAFSYQYLCNRAGLWCISPSGPTPYGAHQWNMIQLDDGYYWVDTTWMDDGHGDRYFCLTDDQLAVDHTPNYPPVLPVCDATKYAYNGGDISI